MSLRNDVESSCHKIGNPLKGVGVDIRQVLS